MTTDEARKLADDLDAFHGHSRGGEAASTIRAQADEIERLTKERDEAREAWRNESRTATLWTARATSAEAALAKAKDALERIDAMDWGWKGGGSEVRIPGKYATIARATLASIDAGGEHPDSVRLREARAAINYALGNVLDGLSFLRDWNKGDREAMAEVDMYLSTLGGANGQ